MKKTFAVLYALLCILLYGCGINDGQEGNPLEQDMSGQNVSGQSVSASVTGKDSEGTETVSGDSYVLLPDQFTANNFYIVSENIRNYEEALNEMAFAQSAERKVISFCDTFPKELQEAFQYEIEHYGDVDVHFGEYNTGLEWHKIEELSYEISSLIPFAEEYIIQYQEIDLDGDGEVEYLLKQEPLSGYAGREGLVCKAVDGELVCCISHGLKAFGMESLSYEGDYYLYIGNALIRCGEGCDLLSYRYEENNWATYSPGLHSIENSYLDYIVAVAENGDFTWHEGYRAEGYEGVDFQSYLPDGLENHLPNMYIGYQTWHFKATDTREGVIYSETFYLPVEAEGKDCEYLFLRYGRNDVIVVVLVPEGDAKYTIACMYKLVHTSEFYLIDKGEYIDDLVENDYLAYYCMVGREQNDSYDEMMKLYQPNHVAEAFPRCHSLKGYPLMVLSYGDGNTAVAVVHGGEFEIIYDNRNDDKNVESIFLEPYNILEHVLDQEAGTESYLYYDICTDDYMDNFTAKIVLRDSFIRVDEDRDGRFTKADSYYCNGYELDKYTWERWQERYRIYSGD